LTRMCGRYQMDKLKEEIRVWHQRRVEAMTCLAYLCRMDADPRFVNAAGESVLDLCSTKHPEVQDQIQQQWDWMVKKDGYLERAASDPEFVIPECKKRNFLGVFPRDRFFMHEYQKAVAKAEAKKKVKGGLGGWGKKGKLRGAKMAGDETSKA
jgi:hypothetical protein